MGVVVYSVFFFSPSHEFPAYSNDRTSRVFGITSGTSEGIKRLSK